VPRLTGSQHLPDEQTRLLVRRMHYAAYRMEQAATTRQRGHWSARYHLLRDAVIVGNHRLIYRVVHNCHVPPTDIDDAIGECQIVLVRAVELYNPWLTIRFSTYVYTCLLRAVRRFLGKVSHLRERVTAELEQVPELGEVDEPEGDAAQAGGTVSRYLLEEHPLLTEREKIILSRRFLADDAHLPTLKMLSSELGISKERVRQLQSGALNKIRLALSLQPDERYGVRHEAI
jgi:RNA polymerase sigma factor (sigma-70 family)